MTQSLMGAAAKFAHAANTESKSAPKKTASKKSKATKPVAKKAAPITPKAKGNLDPAKATSAGERRIDPDAVIRLVHRDHNFGGKRAEALSLLKDGITVAKFKSACESKKLSIYWGPSLRRALHAKMISFK
jgi:hypothetical protein